MLSYQDLYTECQNQAQDTSTAAETYFKSQLNIGQNLLETELGSFYTDESTTADTVDGTSLYDTPSDLVRLKLAFIEVGEIDYVLEEVYDEHRWRRIKANEGSSESDAAMFIFVKRDTYEIYPTPATDSNTINLIYEAGGKELQFDDYTDGTISALANGAAAVTGDSTTFTAAMVGRYLKVTSDGIWYKISAYTSATAITLDKNFQGTTIAAGAEAYTIGEMPRTPPSTHMVPVYYAMKNYFAGFKQNTNKSRENERLFEKEMKRAKTTYSRRYSSKYMPGRSSMYGYGSGVVNPNLYPSSMS